MQVKHAGIVTDFHGYTIVTVEGNTSAGPTADPDQQRQGDGIWVRAFPQGGRGDLVTQGFVSVENLLKLAGAAASNDSRLNEKALLFAAHSDDMGGLNKDEKQLLNAFVQFLKDNA